MQPVKDYTIYKSYLDDRVRHYPFISDMVLFYKGLLDIWNAATPDDLSILFKDASTIPQEKEAKTVFGIDGNKAGEVNLTNSIDTALKVFKLFETTRQGDMAMNCSGSSPDAILEFIRDGLSGEERYKNAVLKWILKPSFEYSIINLRIGTISGKGVCPLCLSPPAMAIVSTPENGISEQRLLSCCFCTYRWSYPLTGCPSCGEDRAERFGFIVGDSVRDQCVRAVSCEECKTYLKTVFISCRTDRKRPEDIDIDVEDVATLNLDIMSDQRGYTALCQR